MSVIPETAPRSEHLRQHSNPNVRPNPVCRVHINDVVGLVDVEIPALIFLVHAQAGDALSHILTRRIKYPTEIPDARLNPMDRSCMSLSTIQRIYVKFDESAHRILMDLLFGGLRL